MSIERLKESAERQLTPDRWRHTLGVAETAVRLAQKYGADAAKAEIAAILHDYCKCWPREKQADVLRSHPELPQDLLEYDAELWHAHVGAWVVENELGVRDADVLNAIRWHTSGRIGMTLLEKIVCLADYIEPGRRFPGVDDIRRLAESDLDRALVAGFDATIRFLLDRGKKIYPLTVMSRNALLDEISGKEGIDGRYG
ncbi:MAG: HD domain-containing protein [Candidatus Reconcilbacillus cellulovorans]|uniref:bis(5'-nucleosyl)-tetraphosphatase (symmetrical) n=1 Tax=Candidatus Reconcilbacillus cellulovorans TaxID=1906605 RepID=A0A2A6E2C1_9BACL|nr:MAG: HD domain-containing protein [Candidatus Reconcilbacillus cellulovorans]